MSVFIGFFEDDSGKQFATFVDPERELYYDRVFANVRVFYEGRTVSLHCAEPPSAPPLGDPIMSLAEFAGMIAGSGMPAPSSIAPLLAARAGSREASTILPQNMRPAPQTAVLSLPCADVRPLSGLGTVQKGPASTRADAAGLAGFSRSQNHTSISLMGPVPAAQKRPGPMPSDRPGG